MQEKEPVWISMQEKEPVWISMREGTSADIHARQNQCGHYIASWKIKNSYTLHNWWYVWGNRPAPSKTPHCPSSVMGWLWCKLSFALPYTHLWCPFTRLAMFCLWQLILPIVGDLDGYSHIVHSHHLLLNGSFNIWSSYVYYVALICPFNFNLREALHFESSYTLASDIGALAAHQLFCICKTHACVFCTMSYWLQMVKRVEP